MHLFIILIVLLIAIALRYAFPKNQGSTWQERWQNTLFCFLFPPLLILMTSFAVYWMGHHGKMLGIPASRLGCHLAIAFFLWSSILLLYHGYQGWKTQKSLQQFPKTQLENTPIRLVPTSLPYSAEIGFWQSELLISEGLFDLLDQDHLQAVLAHEKAHKTYRDTFWFFWLGYLKTLTAWLPHSQSLWQELLLLREIRADQTAIQSVDPLMLAESLLTVAQFTTNLEQKNLTVAAFNDDSDRLEQRIEAILNPSSPWRSFSWQNSLWLLFIFLPLLTIPLHH